MQYEGLSSYYPTTTLPYPTVTVSKTLVKTVIAFEFCRKISDRRVSHNLATTIDRVRLNLSTRAHLRQLRTITTSTTSIPPLQLLATNGALTSPYQEAP